jgi:hypothetical protein
MSEMEQVFACPKCGRILEYGTNPCPFCAMPIAWEGFERQGPAVEESAAVSEESTAVFEEPDLAVEEPSVAVQDLDLAIEEPTATLEEQVEAVEEPVEVLEELPAPLPEPPPLSASRNDVVAPGWEAFASQRKEGRGARLFAPVLKSVAVVVWLASVLVLVLALLSLLPDMFSAITSSALGIVMGFFLFGLGVVINLLDDIRRNTR